MSAILRDPRSIAVELSNKCGRRENASIRRWSRQYLWIGLQDERRDRFDFQQYFRQDTDLLAAIGIGITGDDAAVNNEDPEREDQHKGSRKSVGC
jgi:hypothetical protein